MMQTIAYIREAECIGCIKCIKACSDQAILGARKQMHTIITDLCTGCEDCVAVCPVDCIEMIPKPGVIENQTHPAVEVTRHTEPGLPRAANNDGANKKDTIAQAIARTRARRGWN